MVRTAAVVVVLVVVAASSLTSSLTSSPEHGYSTFMGTEIKEDEKERKIKKNAARAKVSGGNG